MKIGILATHPVQYYAAWYRMLARRPGVDLQVFFSARQTPEGQARAGFGVAFDWDIPLLEGYEHRFLKNTPLQKDVSSFLGCINHELNALIRRERFDVFIVHGWHTLGYLQGIDACWRWGVPLCVRGDSQVLNDPATKRFLKFPLYRWFFSRCDGFLVPGTRSRQYYESYGVSAERIHTVVHAVDNGFFEAQHRSFLPQRALLRRTWGIPEDAVVFLFAGKFIEKKRPEDFIRALARAAAGNRLAFGVLAGEGPLRRRLEAVARKTGAAVSFTGFLNQTQISRAYAVCDCLVLPSDSRETWGLVLNEAMACGLPVLCSDQVGAAVDLVLPGETGECFRLGDIAGLAGCMVRLCADRVERERRGARARELIGRYSLEEAAAQTVCAAGALIEKSSRKSR